MKLYVMNPNNQKVYLNLIAPSRSVLANQIGGVKFYLGNNIYHVHDVMAERDSNNSATGAVVGGVVGALGGPIGILIGGFLGGILGNSSDESETIKVNNFNLSHL